MIQFHFHLEEFLPNLTDWIQAICAIVMVAFAWYAFREWKSKEYFAIRKEGIMRVDQALEYITEILYEDGIYPVLDEDQQKKMDLFKSKEEGFARAYYLLLRNSMSRERTKEMREELVRYAHQTQLLPKGDPIRAYYQKFLELANDVPARLARYVNDRFYAYHEKYGYHGVVERIMSQDGHLDDEEFYNSIFEPPHFGRGAILDELLYYRQALVKANIRI